MRKEYVIDTNVPIVANLATKADANTDIPPKCIAACVEHIKRITQDGGLVLDEDGEMLEEYRRYLSGRGQPGQGDAFIKWVFNHQWNTNKVTRVKIHKQGDNYQEFPKHSQLKDFDRSDRKFVAAANARSNEPSDKPAIWQAIDSKWLKWKDALQEMGITVYFLCPEYVSRIYQGKK